ncbi:MAG: hypothetical protein JOZ96_05155 [Acidobacteria bacterium]|nr:hypothetical protein [Acidobacteriota bacterium]
MSRRIFTAALLLLSLARAVSAQEPRTAPEPSKVFREARAASDAFEFEMNGFAYRVAANGNGRRTKGTKVRGFNLRLDRGEAVARLFYSEFEGDLLLLLHTEIAGAGFGFVTRLEQPSMRGLWRQRIPAGDVGRPLRDGRDLYVTGLGVVGKIDLRTGEYAWLHDDLEVEHGPEPKPLHTFDEPELSGDEVLFRERPVYNPRRTLAVSRKTGKVVRVE